ncbi:calcium-binding protein [Azospirillum cavernae]|uniref:calcium-binding protein n=1 Tax=Azospirillum cavernae TaxID=2320860 RepID=UPI000E6C8F43|nr:calcium-binding protein [Azospirillum cavernae]
MRILVAIPHFYQATNLGYYGSLGPDHRPRLASLTASLAALHQVFGSAQGLIFAPEHCLRQTNEVTNATIDIVLCTTGNNHLADHLPAGLCRHHATVASPPLLGYECHTILRNGLGQYDWYVYLEDDIRIEDLFFFQKLMWFQELVGDERCVLQPNRFEVTDTGAVLRLYIDGHPFSRNLVPQQAVGDVPRRIEAPHLGRTIAFQQVPNPHSGCFFLTEAQMRRWAAAPDFLDRATSYIGPLESAATLGLIRHFAVYKPARENAGFLEVRHGDHRYLQRRLAFSNTPPFHYSVVSSKS